LIIIGHIMYIKENEKLAYVMCNCFFKKPYAKNIKFENRGLTS